VKPFIRAMERFSSIGGMLPEQVWDHEDFPQEGMYKGQSAGSAQPLVWAHSEYIKLLRSAADGKVFDSIPVVEERYAVAPGTRTFRSEVEIFQTSRPVAAIRAGLRLRIVDTARFSVHYSTDNWATSATIESHPVGYAGSFADIPTTVGQAGAIVFTLYWPGQDKWLGRNFEVAVMEE
jgi:glucoamylase